MGASGAMHQEKPLPMVATTIRREPYKGSPAPDGGPWVGASGMNFDFTPNGSAIGTPADWAARHDDAGFDEFEQMAQADREWLFRPKQPMCGFCGGHHKHNLACVALTDGFLVKMPWGKHKGLPVADVPHEYLRWLLDKGGDLPGELKAEIERVLSVPTFEESGE